MDFDQASKPKDDLAFLDKLVISKESGWKSLFDLIMMLVSIQNIFFNAFYAGFGVPETYSISYFVDKTFETLFLFDMMFCFCQEYMDEETYNIVSNFKLIAKHYAKSSFIFDFIAWMPFASLVH